ncbi:hypothetical protein AC094_29590 [Bacteroides fragilis]|uniref:Uncharacterized protein n=1 Tax=Bacteroides fragilis TaxID=817 RepID=A0A853PPQ9_BACFG|nr:hypothetical protein M077_1616 [Bacteroides fragilis str. 2-F-2 \
MTSQKGVKAARETNGTPQKSPPMKEKTPCFQWDGYNF